MYLNITSPDVEVQDIRLLNPTPPGAGDAVDAAGRTGLSRTSSMAVPVVPTPATAGAPGCPPLHEDAGGKGAAVHAQQDWLASPLPVR